MSGLSPTALLSIVLGYLAFLFLVASVAEAFAPRLARGRPATLIYVLAASVYCTAWTFYGSVGLAANRGLEFLTIYLGLELMSLSLYAMVALDRDSPLATEAAMKYFVLGALASGMLLYGMSMIYGATGTLTLTDVAKQVPCW